MKNHPRIHSTLCQPMSWVGIRMIGKKKSMTQDGLKELDKYGKNKRVIKNRLKGSYPVRKKLRGEST